MAANAIMASGVGVTWYRPADPMLPVTDASATPVVDVVIPAYNEEATIAEVVRSVPRPPVTRVVVVDNGSTDATAARAREAGATVIPAARRGYGNACLAALAALSDDDDILVFLVADGSDDPAEISRVIAQVAEGRADLVIGSRFLGSIEPGSMSGFQRLGNRVATATLTRIAGQRVTDLGPFRAIRRGTLMALGMRDE